jgi:hypothetical protein
VGTAMQNAAIGAGTQRCYRRRSRLYPRQLLPHCLDNPGVYLKVSPPLPPCPVQSLLLFSTSYVTDERADGDSTLVWDCTLAALKSYQKTT